MNEKIVAIDLGNYNTKFKGDKMGFFSSKYHTKFEMNPEAYKRIEYNNQITYIGVGELEREYDKTSKNVIPQVLYAISESTTEKSINLCLLLPLSQLPKKDIMIEKFKGKCFSFKVNGEEKKIRINECAILPEGQVSYYSIPTPSPFQLMIDIGSKTINWVAYIDGTLFKNGTEKLGTYDLYDIIMKIENAKGNDYIQEDIEAQIKRGRIKVSDDVYKTFLKDILNRIKATINIKNHDPIFTGGGAKLLEEIISQIPKVEIHKDPVFSNIIGAENVCKRMWK